MSHLNIKMSKKKTQQDLLFLHYPKSSRQKNLSVIFLKVTVCVSVNPGETPDDMLEGEDGGRREQTRTPMIPHYFCLFFVSF